MSRFSLASTLSSTSLGSTTDESQANEDSDGGWKESEMDHERSEGACAGRETRERGLSVGQASGKAAPGPHSPKRDSCSATRGRRKRPTSTLSLSGHQGKISSLGNPRGAEGSAANGAARRLFDRVAAIHWVDGGNGGLSGSFPTNPACLASLAARPNLAIRVHGTPYQWRNARRPWLALERDAFIASLEEFRQAFDARDGYTFATDISVGGQGKKVMCAGAGELSEGAGGATTCRVIHECIGLAGGIGRRPRGSADVKRLFYFENEEPSLDVHFQALMQLIPE